MRRKNPVGRALELNCKKAYIEIRDEQFNPKQQSHTGFLQTFGGDKGDRTPDLLAASQARSQLRYTPNEIITGVSIAFFSFFVKFFSG